MWFGHGTKPKDAKTPSVAADVPPPLQDRIHDVGHTLVAGLPASKRHHAVELRNKGNMFGTTVRSSCLLMPFVLQTAL